MLFLAHQAYLEFFVSPEQLDQLIARIESDPQITYHAVNARGDMRTNTTSESPNAVTWGVFPHCEIIQPTIVESISFLAWKDEAYQLGREWANIYAPDSVSRKVINDTFDRFFLVNVVHNDYKAKDAIFEPFFSITDPPAAAAAAAPTTTNGHTSVNGVVKNAADAVSSAVDGIKAALAPAPAPAPATNGTAPIAS